jgi:pilus assembly protein CpaC
MSTQTDLKRVENPNSRVVRVERLADRNNEVLLVGESPGITRVTFTDQNDRVEVHEVIVSAHTMHTMQDKVNKLTLRKGEQKTEIFPKAPIFGWSINRSEVVNIIQSIADKEGKTIVFQGIGAGNATVTFWANKEKSEVMSIWEVDIPAENRFVQLRELIKKIAPTDSVEVHPLTGSRASIDEQTGKFKEEATHAVLLTGTVASAETAQLIAKAANALFPPTRISTASTESGTNVQTDMIDQLNVINQIRVGGVHQIQLEVVVAIVNRSQARNMSFSFAINGTNAFGASFFGAPFSFANAISPGPATVASAMNASGAANIPFGVLNNKNGFLGFLQALSTENLAKVLAEPRVVTLSGRPANILSGGETPLLTSSGQGAPTVSYKQFGTVVNALPIVLRNNKIYLEVKSEISDIDNTLGISIPGITPTIIPGFRTRSAQVAVEIEDGQTLAIGGLIQNTVNASISRVPVLGDLPLLGAAFTSKSYTETEQELVILVTPRLVDPIDCTKIPKYLPGRETRSPDDFELFLEGIMEAPRHPRNVILHPRYFKGAHTLSDNYGRIPCADGDCYGRGGNCATGHCAPGHTSGLRSADSGMARTGLSPMPPVISYSEVPATPTSRPGVIVEPESPSFPSIPRQMDNRPLLPPINR